MHRSLRALVAAAIIGGAVTFTGSAAFAQATPTTTTVQHVVQTVPFAPPPPPCVGSGGFVDIEFNSVVHMNTLPDGRFLVHVTTTGSFTAHPFSGPDSTGRFNLTESDKLDYPIFTSHMVFTIIGRDTTGNLSTFHQVLEITEDLSANTITVDVVQLNCP